MTTQTRRQPAKRRPAPRRGRARVTPIRQADRPKVEVLDEELEDFNETINMIIHGDPGVGKTVLAMAVPNATLLSTERGAVAAKRAGHTGRLWRAPSWPHVEAALDRADNEMGPEDWLVVDTGTKMQVLLWRHWLWLQHEENDARDQDVPQIQDHLKFQNMFMRFYDRLADAPYNTIMLAWSMHKDDPDGESIVLPQILGKDYAISNYCCGVSDMVLYYGVARSKDKRSPTVRRLLAETYPPYFAKDVYHVLPRWTDIQHEDYTAMARIVKAIQETDPAYRKEAKANTRTARAR